MSDELNLTPELTLDPSGTAAQAAAAPELTLEPTAAQAAPELTLEPTAPQAPQPDAAAIQAQRDANAVKLDESMLSDAEKKMVDEFAKKIDVTDSNLVLQYGAAAQKNIAAFSENALNSVKTKDLGEVGQALSDLVVELKGFGEEEGEEGYLRLLPEEAQGPGGPEGQLCQGRGQRGQDRPGAGVPSGGAHEGYRHAGPDV